MADLDERPFEGRTTLARKLKTFLEQKGFSFTNKVCEADLIHVHSSGIGISYKAYQLKKKYKIPVIYTLYSNCKTELIRHITNFMLQNKVLEKGATSGILSYSAILPLSWRGMFLKKLDKIIVPSNYLKKQLFPNTKIIKFGINVNKFKPLPISKSNKNKDKIKVAFFGHPGVFKGQTDFILASKKFSRNIKPYMFFTKRSSKTDNYIKEHNPKVQIYGHVEDIVKVYNEIDLIVLPYRNPLGAIANPLILLEAMACEKPVITTNLPFLKEIVGDSAITVPPYNYKKLAKVINWLAKNKEVQKTISKKARERVINDYNEQKMFEEYLKLYQSLKE